MWIIECIAIGFGLVFLFEVGRLVVEFAYYGCRYFVDLFTD
jgi:hypothetical protein